MPSTPSARKAARELSVQGLYQWTMAGQPIKQIAQSLLDSKNPAKIDGEYFNEIILASARQSEQLDIDFTPFLEIPMEQLDPVSLSILRIGCYEMQFRIDVPYKVIINEGVNLAKKFGPTDSNKFVNAVLDRLAQQYRKVELGHG